jgi:hypothetical protein
VERAERRRQLTAAAAKLHGERPQHACQPKACTTSREKARRRSLLVLREFIMSCLACTIARGSAAHKPTSSRVPVALRPSPCRSLQSDEVEICDAAPGKCYLVGAGPGPADLLTVSRLPQAACSASASSHNVIGCRADNS